ncbi:DUF192 domain-containing protein [Bacillus sp. JJ1566]|uniref:DUF192 domain-containing protein n=1 Tax=Bacillus sp. JJ1566 TaxID=3122961 RepID=UPI002FFE0BD2
MKRSLELDLPIIKADTFMKRFKGLMFERKPYVNKALHLTPCDSIHMFFMRFPLDIVFLDKENRIVDVRHNLQPWRIAIPKKRAYSTLELPAGTIKKNNIQIGDQVVL